MSFKEQRKYPRVKPPKSLVVAWQVGLTRDVSYIESLCLGGLFVRTRQPVPLRSLVQVLLDMPLGQVRGNAIVRRVKEHTGMAVEFITMNPEDRARLYRQMRSFLSA